MRVFRGFEELPQFANAVVTVGSFDGLHRGHLSLLRSFLDMAREGSGESVVLTFDKHPRVVLGRAEGLRLLTSIEEKISLFEELGIDNLIIIPFDREFSRLSQEQFVKGYLVEKIGVKRLVMGYNHRLGRGNDATHDDLVELSRECGFEVAEMAEWRDDECGNVSSTVVRKLLSTGYIERANSLLSRPYAILGQVDEGGRVWVDDALKMIPAPGDYSVAVDGVASKINIDDNGVMVLECEVDMSLNSVKIEFLC